MQILKVDGRRPEAAAIRRAASVLEEGGLVVYPADTAGYSLGANALNDEAVRKVFLIKKRNFTKPLNLVAGDVFQAQRFVEWPPSARILAERFLPGPLALVLPKRKIISDLVTAGRPSVGVRIPDSPVALALAKLVTFPFTMTTANISGTVTSAYNLEEILAQVGRGKIKPDLILDCGQLPKVPPSTILDLTVSPPRILRLGPISAGQIEAVLCLKIGVSQPLRRKIGKTAGNISTP